MKKVFLAAFASLMLAGTISAASGLTCDRIASCESLLLTDGTSPIAVPAAPTAPANDLASLSK